MKLHKIDDPTKSKPIDKTLLDSLVGLRDGPVQKNRIAFGNRLAAIERGDDHADEGTIAVLRKYFDAFSELEGRVNDDITDAVEGNEMIERITQIKGIGTILAAKLVSMIDINKANTASALWRYAGFGVITTYTYPCGHDQEEKETEDQTKAREAEIADIKVKIEQAKALLQAVGIGVNINVPVPSEPAASDPTHCSVCGAEAEWIGKAERPRKGQRLAYNKHLKTTCYLIGESFMRSNSPYRRVYDDARQREDTLYPDDTPMHRHRKALRKMIKVFLVHLWQEWRKAEGLDYRAHYAADKLDGHTMVYKAEDFGWMEELPDRYATKRTKTVNEAVPPALPVTPKKRGRPRKVRPEATTP